MRREIRQSILKRVCGALMGGVVCMGISLAVMFHHANELEATVERLTDANRDLVLSARKPQEQPVAEDEPSGQTLPSANYLRDDVQYYPAGSEDRLPNQRRALEEYRLRQENIQSGLSDPQSTDD